MIGGGSDRTMHRRPSVAGIVTGAAVLVALLSALRSGPHLWHSLGVEQRTYAHSTAVDDRHALFDALSLDGQAFDFFAAHLEPGDRFYFQVPPATGDDANRLGAAIAAASFYLLPAVRTTDLKDANVIVSYEADPSALGVPIAREVSDGQRFFSVSRLGGL